MTQLTGQVFAIQITQDDISEGVRFLAGRCPAALAVTKALAPYVQFDEVKIIESVYFSYLKDGDFVDKWIRVANLPQQVKQWVSDFDMGKSVKPITFSIEVFAPASEELQQSNAFLFDRELTPSFNIDTTVLRH